VLEAASSGRASRKAYSGRRRRIVSAFSSVDLPTFVYRRGRRWAFRCGGVLPPDVALLRQLFQPGARQRVRRRAIRRSVRAGLARAPRADTAAETLEVLPHAAPCVAGRTRAARARLKLSSALTACWAKCRDQERAVDDRALSSFSSSRCCDGESSSSTRSTSHRVVVRLLQLVELALADVRCADRAADGAAPAARRLDTAVRASSSSSASSSSARPLCEHSQDEPALGSSPARDQADEAAIDSHYDDCRARPRPRARTLQLVDVPSRAATRQLSSPSCVSSSPERRSTRR